MAIHDTRKISDINVKRVSISRKSNLIDLINFRTNLFHIHG